VKDILWTTFSAKPCTRFKVLKTVI